MKNTITTTSVLFLALLATTTTRAALLHSDDFPTLKPGYWVVFDGQYDSIAQAQSQAATDRGKSEFSDALTNWAEPWKLWPPPHGGCGSVSIACWGLSRHLRV